MTSALPVAGAVHAPFISQSSFSERINKDDSNQQGTWQVHTQQMLQEKLCHRFHYNSSAKSEGNFSVKVDWLVDLPTVSGRIWLPNSCGVWELSCCTPPRINGRHIVVPLYPNMHKTAVCDERTGKLNQGPAVLNLDAGPGRIVSSERILVHRAALFDCDLIAVMGLPNTTSVQQEMDALYGPFKSATYVRGEKVMQEKFQERGLAKGNVKQLPCAVLNLGTANDINSNRPFNTHFTNERILWLWANVGFVSFTRSCLDNKRVRKELKQHKKTLAGELTTSLRHSDWFNWRWRIQPWDLGRYDSKGGSCWKGSDQGRASGRGCSAMEGPSPLLDSGITANPVLWMLERCQRRPNTICSKCFVLWGGSLCLR